MKLRGDVIIELTRWCNFECEHCLRGNKQRKRNKKEYIHKFLLNFDSIDTITFTGGEPSLAPDLINYTIDCFRMQGLDVNYYYIVTNAHKISKAFLNAWERLHHWCSNFDNAISGINISNDQFHQDNDDAWKLFDYAEFHGLPVSYRYNQFKPDYHNVISEGNAEHWGNDRKTESYEYELEIYEDEDILEYREGGLYLNCKGNIINGCDWSFESQDKPENIIAHVNDFKPETLIEYMKHK